MPTSHHTSAATMNPATGANPKAVHLALQAAAPEADHPCHSFRRVARQGDAKAGQANVGREIEHVPILADV